jgi:transposase-like protein
LSQTYTEEDREEALELLGYNRNNIALTSTQTGIPERTLREWRRKQRNSVSLPPDPSPESPTGSAEMRTMKAHKATSPKQYQH